MAGFASLPGNAPGITVQATRQALTSSQLYPRQPSTHSWDAVCHSAGTVLRETLLSNTGRRHAFRRYQTSSCTARTSRGFPEEALLCTTDMRTLRDAAAWPNAITPSIVSVLPNNSAG